MTDLPPDEPTRWIPPRDGADEPTQAFPGPAPRPADEPTRVVPAPPPPPTGPPAVPPPGPPPYGGVGGGLPPGEEPNPSRTMAAVALGLLVVLLLLVGLLLASRHHSKGAAAPTTTTAVATTPAPTSTAAPTTLATTTTIVRTTVAPTTTVTMAPTTTRPPASGNRAPTTTERAQILASVDDSHPGYQVTSIRIANSDPTWAALNYDGGPSQQPFAEVRHLANGTWGVVSTGTAQVACSPSIPPRVQQDFADILGAC